VFGHAEYQISLLWGFTWNFFSLLNPAASGREETINMDVEKNKEAVFMQRLNF